ncbi:MAG TPA: glycerophosphodiester phosphodiesterase [Candidatus Binatia bacterium]|nr:glycerophosphodiester phosphodiesterase [Candidatus Binatia bacterium]
MLAVGCLVAPASADSSRAPLVIGHRGAAGYLPDHTLEGYALAIELGADYIEPDLVATKDGHLIARHEPNMIATTDVSTRPEFASRRRTAVVDGFAEDGWFASDFTLAEIKTLRAVQPLPERPQQFNGRFEIPTLEEVIALAKRKAKEKDRVIGIYPETKHPTYHKSIGLPLEARLLRVLRAAGWDRRDAPVFIQSFEQSNLKELSRLTKIRLIQLVDANDVNPDGTLDYTAPFDRPYDWTASGDPRLLARTFGFFATDEGLREIRTYADGLGPWKRYIVSTKAIKLNPNGTVADANGDGLVNEADLALLPPTDLIRRAHAHGLLVHTWTFRNEQRRLPSDYAGNPVNEYLQLYQLGIDGVFSDFADTAVAARVLFRLSTDADFARCLTGDFDGGFRRDCR